MRNDGRYDRIVRLYAGVGVKVRQRFEATKASCGPYWRCRIGRALHLAALESARTGSP